MDLNILLQQVEGGCNAMILGVLSQNQDLLKEKKGELLHLLAVSQGKKMEKWNAVWDDLISIVGRGSMRADGLVRVIKEFQNALWLTLTTPEGVMAGSTRNIVKSFMPALSEEEPREGSGMRIAMKSFIGDGYSASSQFKMHVWGIVSVISWIQKGGDPENSESVESLGNRLEGLNPAHVAAALGFANALLTPRIDGDLTTMVRELRELNEVAHPGKIITRKKI